MCGVQHVTATPAASRQPQHRAPVSLTRHHHFGEADRPSLRGLDLPSSAPRSPPCRLRRLASASARSSSQLLICVPCPSPHQLAYRNSSGSVPFTTHPKATELIASLTADLYCLIDSVWLGILAYARSPHIPCPAIPIQHRSFPPWPVTQAMGRAQSIPMEILA